MAKEWRNIPLYQSWNRFYCRVCQFTTATGRIRPQKSKQLPDAQLLKYFLAMTSSKRHTISTRTGLTCTFVMIRVGRAGPAIQGWARVAPSRFRCRNFRSIFILTTWLRETGLLGFVIRFVHWQFNILAIDIKIERKFKAIHKIAEIWLLVLPWSCQNGNLTGLYNVIAGPPTPLQGSEKTRFLRGCWKRLGKSTFSQYKTERGWNWWHVCHGKVPKVVKGC